MLIDLDKSDDEKFVDWYRGIPRASVQETLSSYLPSEPYVRHSYDQDWPSYDLAKTNETILFKQLLPGIGFV